MEKMLEVREYLEKIEEKIKACTEHIPQKEMLRCIGVTDTGVPVFYGCEFLSSESYEIDTIDEDNVIFILSDGSIVERVGLATEEQDNNIATAIIEANEQYKSYYHMRYGNRPVLDFALEALVKQNSAIYVRDRIIYIPKYAGAFTTPISALWSTAVKYSDIFSEYKYVVIENKADNPESHIEFYWVRRRIWLFKYSHILLWLFI